MIKESLWVVSIFLFIIPGVTAQHKTSVETINPFTYGNQVTTVEDNFENLFRNIPCLVSNPESIKFTGYHYVDTVQNIQDAKEYGVS